MIARTIALCLPILAIFGGGAAAREESAGAPAEDAAGPPMTDLAHGDRTGLRELGFRVEYGSSTQRNIQVVPFSVHAGWLFPDCIDAPLARLNLDLEYRVEGWIAGVTGPQNAIEVGINPIGFKLAYDAGQRVVPYFAAGIGVLYTGLQGVGIGGPFQFNETAGVGVEIFLERDLSLTLGYRYRHVSNADIYEDNRGIDTQFGTIGLSWYPKR